jgi:hypothetical protein
MKDLKSMGAAEAQKLLRDAHEELIDVAQHCRNVYTGGERLNEEIEARFTHAFDNLQKGRSWVKALEEA